MRIIEHHSGFILSMDNLTKRNISYTSGDGIDTVWTLGLIDGCLGLLLSSSIFN